MRIGLVTDIHNHSAELARALDLFRDHGVDQVVTIADTCDAFCRGDGAGEVAWPTVEGSEWDKMNSLQGIGGTLELFHRSTLSFQKIVGEATGHPVRVSAVASA